MRFPIAVLLVLLWFPTAFSQSKPILEYKGDFGLYAVDDSILLHKYLERENQLILVGRRNLQLLDLETFKIVHTRPIALPFGDRRSDYQYVDWPISPDGRHMVLLGLKEARTKTKTEDEQAAWIVDLQTGKRVALLDQPEEIRKAVWSTDGKTLMTMSDAGVNPFTKTLNVSFWDGETFAHQHSIEVENVTWIYFSNDGRRFFAASGKPKNLLGIKYVADSGSVVRIWKTESGQLEKTIAVSDSEFQLKTREIELSPDEDFLIVANKHKSNSSRHRLLVWKINADIKPRYVLQPKPKVDDSRVMFSPNGKSFAVDVGKNLQIYETETGKLKTELTDFEMPSSGWLDNETLASIDFKAKNFFEAGRMLKAFDSADGRLLFKQRLAYEEGRGVGVDEDETVINDDTMLRRNPTRQMFLTSSNKFLKVFNSRTGELLQTVVGPQIRIDLMGKPKVIPGDMVWSADWTKDGKALYVFSADHRSISLWRLIE